MAWYIESWDVADGYAFAGFRGSISEEPESLTYVSAPHFDPIPVRDMATVRWSTRGTFQERLYGDDNREVRFGSLDQVIEMVRRGYLASGTGTPPEEGPGGIGRPPSPLGPEDPSEGGGNAPIGPEALMAKFRDVVKRLGVEGSRAELTSILFRLMSFKRIGENLRPRIRQRVDPHAILTEIAPDSGVPPHIVTFGDHLAAITSDRLHVLSLTWDTLRPALIAAILVVGSMRRDAKGIRLAEIVKEAAAWLAAEIPDSGLASAKAAEEIIHAIAKGRWSALSSERTQAIQPSSSEASQTQSSMAEIAAKLGVEVALLEEFLASTRTSEGRAQTAWSKAAPPDRTDDHPTGEHRGPGKQR
jgi:hypothetical protein